MGQEGIGNLPMLSMALLGAVWVLTLYVHSLCGFVEISTCIFLIYFFSSFFFKLNCEGSSRTDIVFTSIFSPISTSGL